MTIRMFFTILAVLSFLFGISFVLAPDQVLANYGIEHSPACWGDYSAGRC